MHYTQLFHPLYTHNATDTLCKGQLVWITGFVQVREVRAEVVDHIEVAPLLQPIARLAEGLLRNLRLLLTAQHQLVTLVGALHHLQDVRVIRRVLTDLGSVYKSLNLMQV